MLHFDTSVVTLRAAKVGFAKVGGCLGDFKRTEWSCQLKRLAALVKDVYPVANLL